MFGTFGSAYYDANTTFDSYFDPVAAGWTFIPEPVPSLSPLGLALVSGLLGSFGVMGLATRRSRST